MRLDFKRNVKKGVIWGTLSKLITLFFSFALRTIIIREIGKDYIGLGGLFTSVLDVLNLLELGIGTGFTFFMYKPIAEDDYVLLYGILNTFKKLYYIVGVSILFLGMFIVPFLSNLINGEYPVEINLEWLFIIHLVGLGAKYLFFAYRGTLLVAYQKNDVINIINILCVAATSTIQIVLLYVTKNYYPFAVVSAISPILNNFLLYMYSYKVLGKEDNNSKVQIPLEIIKEMREKIRGVFIGNVCDLSRKGIGAIYVSAYMGLSETTLYNNYLWIINSLSSFMLVAYTSLQAGIGNKAVLNSKEDNYEEFRVILFIYMWISSWATICLLCMYQPFTEYAWGKEMLLPMKAMATFVISFYIMKLGDVLSLYSMANGMWWKKRWVAVVETATNIFILYIGGKYFGIIGIVLGPAISVLVVANGIGAIVDFSAFFEKKKVLYYFGDHLRYAITTLIIGTMTYLLCKMYKGDLLMELIVRGTICIVIPNILFLCIYRNNNLYRYAKEYLIHEVRRAGK